MQFHANHVSTLTFAGVCYQAMFEADEEADDPHSPYLLIQRQFEHPEDHLCYVETHDENYIGISFCVALNSLYMGCQLSSIARMTNLLNVTFTMAPSDFEEASCVVKIIAGEIDPQ